MYKLFIPFVLGNEAAKSIISPSAKQNLHKIT